MVMSKFPKNVGDLFRKRGDSRPVGSRSLARAVAPDTRPHIIVPCGGGGTTTVCSPTITDNLDAAVRLIWYRNGTYERPYAVAQEPNNIVRAITSYTAPDGTVYMVVGGSFTTIGGVAASRVASWNGTSWAAMGSGLNNTVSSLCVYQGALYAGGAFTLSGANARNRIARWNPVTSAWDAVASNDLNGTVYSMAEVAGSDDGTGTPYMVLGGAFTAFGANGCAHLAKYSISLDAFAEACGGTDNFVYSVLALNDTDPTIVYGGTFTTDLLGITSLERLAYGNIEDDTHAIVDNGLADTVFSLCRSAVTNEFFAGGAFTEISLTGTPLYHLARCTTASLQEFTGTRQTVQALLYSDGVVYVGGNDLVYLGGKPVIHLGKIVGNQSFPLGSGVGIEASQGAILNFAMGVVPPLLGPPATPVTGGGVFIGGAFLTAFI